MADRTVGTFGLETLGAAFEVGGFFAAWGAFLLLCGEIALPVFTGSEGAGVACSTGTEGLGAGVAANSGAGAGSAACSTVLSSVGGVSSANADAPLSRVLAKRAKTVTAFIILKTPFFLTGWRPSLLVIPLLFRGVAFTGRPAVRAGENG